MRLRSRQCPVWRVHVGLLCQLCGLLLTRESPSVEETASPPRPVLPLPLFLGLSVPGSSLVELELISCSLSGLIWVGLVGRPGNCRVSALGT